MIAIRWSQLARRDTRNIFASIETADPEAALRVIDAIEASVERLIDFPFSAPATGFGDARKLSVPRYDYLVFYRVRGEIVDITRIRHAHENWRQP